MSRRDLTGLARLPLFLANRGVDFGLDATDLLSEAGFGDTELDNPDARVSVTKIWNLWRIVIDRTADPALGVHIGDCPLTRQLGLVGYTMAYSSTLRQALERLARYSQVISEAAKFDLHPAEGAEVLEVEKSPYFDALRHPIDARLASALSIAREITGVEIVPKEVRFPYAESFGSPEHRKFFRAPLRFDCSKAGVVFFEADADRVAAAADSTLLLYLDQMAETILESVTEPGSFIDQVHHAIWRELSGGKPSLESTSRVLGVSIRTLQRRLREERTTFAAVLESFRHDMAIRLLHDPTLAVYEIAYLLGYADPSTFYRAFRRWKGSSPHEYRATRP